MYRPKCCPEASLQARCIGGNAALSTLAPQPRQAVCGREDRTSAAPAAAAAGLRDPCKRLAAALAIAGWTCRAAGSVGVPKGALQSPEAMQDSLAGLLAPCCRLQTLRLPLRKAQRARGKLITLPAVHLAGRISLFSRTLP